MMGSSPIQSLSRRTVRAAARSSRSTKRTPRQRGCVLAEFARCSYRNACAPMLQSAVAPRVASRHADYLARSGGAGGPLRALTCYEGTRMAPSHPPWDQGPSEKTYPASWKRPRSPKHHLMAGYYLEKTFCKSFTTDVLAPPGILAWFIAVHL